MAIYNKGNMHVDEGNHGTFSVYVTGENVPVQTGMTKEAAIKYVDDRIKPVRELVKIDKPRQWGNSYWTYGDFIIDHDYVGFLWSIKEWDLDDPRIGNEATIELCVAAIEEWIADNE